MRGGRAGGRRERRAEAQGSTRRAANEESKTAGGTKPRERDGGIENRVDDIVDLTETTDGMQFGQPS